MRPATKKRIRELGYKSYNAYLLSPAWRVRRDQYFSSHPRRCHFCQSPNSIQLHHITYERIGQELDQDFLPICKKHHRGLHLFIKHKRAKLETAHLKYARHLKTGPKKKRRKKSSFLM